jgi:hypothetical protein
MSRSARFAIACLLISGCRGDGASGGETDASGTETSDSSGESGTGETGDSGGDEEPVPVDEPWAARLTDVQYRYTVEDVLGVELTAGEVGELPPDIPTGRDYSTAVPTQAFSAQYVLAYADVSRTVTARLDPDALLSTHGDCEDATDQGCLEAFVRGLGLRLYRRPLSDEEVDRLLDLAAAITAGEHNTDADVVPGIVQAMMQMPQFLYRIERETEGEMGELRALDGYELATRLSYFLWQSAPDEALLEFAAGPDGDGIYDESALPDEVERMLADPRFARSRDMFWGDYTMASRSSFGTSDIELAAELRDSLMLTLQRLSGVDAEPQPLSDLFDGEELVMTPAVATLAGIEFPVGGAAVYDVADTQQRLGVVTHPAFLASIGTTSFVGRGLFLSERLLCQQIAEPPASAAEEIENTAQATENMTPREASEFRFDLDPVCQVCHLQFEPVAYAFERYDITGAYTPRDEDGRDLFSDGVLPLFDDRPEIAFDDAQQLLTELAPLPSTQRCFVHNMAEFGFGRAPLSNDAWLDTAAETFTELGSDFDALIRVIALSDQLAHVKVVEPG